MSYIGVQKAMFCPEVDQNSPVFGDVMRVVERDEDGREINTFLPVDYEKIRKDNGPVNMWSLENLLKAGVDPSFPVKTGLNSRVEGISELNSMESQVNALFESESQTPKED